MEFPTVKLLDYNKKWAQLEADPSPFAVVVMAHLKARLKAENERFDWKLRLIRMLIERGYSKPEIVKLFRFIDWLVTIPEAMESRFIEEAGKYFEEEQMPYITTPERVGMRKGRHQAALSLVSRLLKRRFGELEPELVQRVSALTADQLEELGEALLDFSQVSDVSDWLNDKGL
jgi:hypothetical protein